MLKNKVGNIHEIDRVYLPEFDADIIKYSDYIDFFGHKYLYEARPRNEYGTIRRMYLDPNYYFYTADSKYVCMATRLNSIKKGFVL